MSAHRVHDLRLMAAIKEIHQGFRRTYGARRVHQVLRSEGHDCSVRRVNRLMREMGVDARTTRLYPWRPGLHKFYSSVENKLAKVGEAQKARTQWAGDLTFIKIPSGHVYMAIVMDLFSRKIVGWSFSQKRDVECTKSALRAALNRHRPESGCLFHSDQGSEYAAHDYREYVESSGLVRSMSRKATPQDNGKVESFFHTLKAELIYKRKFKTTYEVVADVMEYINFYNQERLHSSLGYQSPENYEKLCA
jgi:transposase InsO family protein